MKKKKVTLLAAALTLCALAGCGKEPAALKDMDVDQYVTLGDYRNLEIEEPTVDEEQWDALVRQVYFENVTVEYGITDRAVKSGDTANIDYVGKLDGVAFEGGTASGTNLTIGSGSFIDGFEEGLIGVMPGETVDLELSFPESYRNNPALAGKAVVFTVKVNCIFPEELNSDAIASFGVEGVTNEEELRQYVYDYLYQRALQNAQKNLSNRVMRAFIGQCVFGELPKDLLERYEQDTREKMESWASGMNVSVEEYAKLVYNMEYEALVADYSLQALQQDIALQAVANRENLTISDEELNTRLQQYASASGFDTVEDYMKDKSMEEYRNYFMYEKVLDWLVDSVDGAEQ